MNVRAAMMALAVADAPAAAAAGNFSPARLAQFARLPDWSGTWRLRGSELLIDRPDATEDSYNKGVRAQPPYNAEWEAKYRLNLQREQKQGDASAADQLTDTFTLYCLTGMPRFLISPFQYQFVNSPGITWIMAGGELRQVYTDGRPRPDHDTIWPKFYGWSSGEWRGSHLYIETTDIVPGLWADTTPVTFSENVRIQEHLHQAGADTIQDDIEIIDPVSLTRPWKVTRYYDRAKEDWIDEREVCGGPNERHPVVDGKVTTKLN